MAVSLLSCSRAAIRRAASLGCNSGLPVFGLPICSTLDSFPYATEGC